MTIFGEHFSLEVERIIEEVEIGGPSTRKGCHFLIVYLEVLGLLPDLRPREHIPLGDGAEMVLIQVYPMVVSALDTACQFIEVIDDQILNIGQLLIFEHPLFHPLGQCHSNRSPILL